MATNNPLAIFDPAQTPAHVKAAQEAGTSNIVTRSQVNALTFPGKVWAITIDGSKKPLLRTNQDGEEEAVQVVDVVIVAYNENRGRAYYPGSTYDPNSPKAPVCWSNDGITSSPNASERQSEKCSNCPQAIKGSRQTDMGKPAAACRVHRHLAVIPRSKDLSTSPLLRLQIPQTSDFDGLNKEAQAKGLFAFTNYLNFLKSRQVPFTYSLTTKIRFDNTKQYPKLWFSPGRWLTEDEATVCAEIAASAGLDDLLKTDFSGFAGTQRPPGITEEDEAENDEIEVVDEGEEVIIQKPAPKAAPAPKPEPAPTPKAAPASAKNGKQTAAQKKAEAAAAAAAARKAAVLEDDEYEAEEAAPKAAPKAAAPTPAPAGTPALDNILKDWDDE
jgi:hypothetical protein